MRSTKITGTLIMMFLFALQLDPLSGLRYSLLGPRAVIAATQKPRCPRRPIDWHGKWPPSWCYEPTSKPSNAELLLQLAAVQEGSQGAAIQVYQLVTHNSGRGATDSATLMLPFDPTLLSVLDVQFSSPQAWVSVAPTDTLKMQLGALKGGEAITTTVRLRTLSNAQVGANVAMRASVEWHAKANSGTSHSNRLQLALIPSRIPSSLDLLDLTPVQGSSSTVFNTMYDGFSSNERVSIWYHEPGGVAIGLGEQQADTEGRVSYSLSAKKLAAGRYTVVMYGQFSQVSATGAFTVSAAPTP